MPLNKLLFSAFCILFAVTSHAQIVFTVTATAPKTAAGYETAESYTFSFTLSPSFNDSASSFSPTENKWLESSLADDQLFSAVTGDVTGTFTRSISPYSQVIVRNSTFMLNVATLEGSVGLASLDGTDVGLSVYIWNFPDIEGRPVFAFPNTFVEPNSYFSDYIGSYVAVGTLSVWDLADTSTAVISLDVTQFTISAIPEPSTYAILAGAGVLGFALLRRRKARLAAGS
jgi:PEP-CTERM putative exosortase interaction domain